MNIGQYFLLEKQKSHSIPTKPSIHLTNRACTGHKFLLDFAGYVLKHEILIFLF